MSKLDKIADIISELELGGPGLDLITAMEEFRTKSRRSFAQLYRAPGFRKLWDALEEAAIFDCRGDLTELPKSVFDRHPSLAEMMAGVG